MNGAGPLNASKRPVARGDHGRAKAHRKIARFGLSEAADNLGIATLTLRRKLQGKGIECSRAGTYSLRQIVEAVSVNGESSKEISLAAHGRLETNKARPVQLEIYQQEKELIRKEPVMKFLGGLVQQIYRTAESRGLDQSQLSNLCHSIESSAESYCLAEGHPLMTIAEAREARDRWPHLRGEAELWARLMCEKSYSNEERSSEGPAVTAAR